MKIQLALSYNDVLLIPQKLTFKSRQEIDLTTKLAPGLEIKIPVISTNMDSVTGVEMAVAMSNLGAISFYPRFDKPEIEANNIEKIKKQKGRVIASIGIRDDYIMRSEYCLKAGADGLILDIAHAHSENLIKTIIKIKNKFKTPLIAGTVAAYDGAYDLYKAGADCVRVGIGAASICTTRIVAGSGVPQITAIIEASRAKKKFKNKYLIADGGITSSGEIVKAIGAGADAVSCGYLFAGTDETPGKIVEKNGIFYKEYNASTSKTEKINQVKKDGNGKKAHYTIHVEGVESLVKYKGPIKDLMEEILAGIRSGLSYSGAKNIKQMQQKAKFVQITNAGYLESLPHDVIVVQ